MWLSQIQIRFYRTTFHFLFPSSLFSVSTCRVAAWFQCSAVQPIDRQRSIDAMANEPQVLSNIYRCCWNYHELLQNVAASVASRRLCTYKLLDVVRFIFFVQLFFRANN